MSGAIRLSSIAVVLIITSACPAFAGVDIVVDRATQTMYVSVDGTTKYTWPVSTGRSGHVTPPGNYRPGRLKVSWFSHTYHHSPMPHSIFFDDEGDAIHGTDHTARLGSPVSHGCVRLDPENAATLFEMVEPRRGETKITIK